MPWIRATVTNMITGAVEDRRVYLIYGKRDVAVFAFQHACLQWISAVWALYLGYPILLGGAVTLFVAFAVMCWAEAELSTPLPPQTDAA